MEEIQSHSSSNSILLLAFVAPPIGLASLAEVKSFESERGANAITDNYVPSVLTPMARDELLNKAELLRSIVWPVPNGRRRELQVAPAAAGNRQVSDLQLVLVVQSALPAVGSCELVSRQRFIVSVDRLQAQTMSRGSSVGNPCLEIGFRCTVHKTPVREYHVALDRCLETALARLQHAP